MCSKPLQVRIGSLVPTTYNAVVGGINDSKPEPWCLHKPREFQAAIAQQMRALASEWDRLSLSSIEIVHLPAQVDPEVTRLQRLGKRQPLDKKQHEITKPSINTLINEACAKDERLRDARVYYVWIVFPQGIYYTAPLGR